MGAAFFPHATKVSIQVRYKNKERNFFISIITSITSNLLSYAKSIPHSPTKKYLHIEIRHFTAYIRSDFPGERTALYEFAKISRGGATSHRSRRRSSLENSTVWSVESPVEMATTSTRLLPRKPHRGFFPCRIVRQVLRVALAAFSAAPWQGFEKAERCPSLASLFPPQAAVGSAAVRIHPPGEFRLTAKQKPQRTCIR
jgi:hypothetical protein